MEIRKAKRIATFLVQNPKCSGVHFFGLKEIKVKAYTESYIETDLFDWTYRDDLKGDVVAMYISGIGWTENVPEEYFYK